MSFFPYVFSIPLLISVVAVHAGICSQVNYASPLFTALLLPILTTVIKSLPITLQKVCLLDLSDGGMLQPSNSLTPHKLSPSSLNHCNFHLFLPFLVFPSQEMSRRTCLTLTLLLKCHPTKPPWHFTAQIKVLRARKRDIDLRCQQGFPSKDAL